MSLDYRKWSFLRNSKRLRCHFLMNFSDINHIMVIFEYLAIYLWNILLVIQWICIGYPLNDSQDDCGHFDICHDWIHSSTWPLGWIQNFSIFNLKIDLPTQKCVGGTKFVNYRGLLTMIFQMNRFKFSFDDLTNFRFYFGRVPIRQIKAIYYIYIIYI